MHICPALLKETLIRNVVWSISVEPRILQGIVHAVSPLGILAENTIKKQVTSLRNLTS